MSTSNLIITAYQYDEAVGPLYGDEDGYALLCSDATWELFPHALHAHTIEVNVGKRARKGSIGIAFRLFENALCWRTLNSDGDFGMYDLYDEASYLLIRHFGYNYFSEVHGRILHVSIVVVD